MENAIRLNIDTYPFMLAFERSDGYEIADSPRITFLDRETGELVWAYKWNCERTVYEGARPEDSSGLREQIAARPERYLEIRGLTHDDHHEMLRTFLQTTWTDDDDLRDMAYVAYTGTIGEWRYRVGEEIYALFEFYRMDVIQALAERWLVKHRIRPNWT